MTLGLMLGILSLTGCQKDNTDSSVNIESEKALSFTLLSEDTRTIYEEGSGVHMTGDEIVAVLYTYTDGTCISAKGQIAQAEKTSANEDGTFNYTFTPNPDAGKSVADYMFVLPYNSDVNFDGASTADDFLSMQSLFTVQEPTATSFDGNSDVLIGRRTAASELETGNANILFKRMFAPLKIVLKGLDANEKVQAVTISTTGTPDRNKNTNILSGASYVVQSPNYDDAILKKWHSSRFSGGLTANYRAGLAANSEGNFDVWFVANPVTLDGIKVSVVTDSRIIERTINKAVPIEPHKLNKMAINMAGDGATSVDAITFNLLGTDNLTTGIPTGAGTDNVTEEFTLSGSDGKAYTWARTGQSLFYKSRGLRFPANCTSYIQLPVFEGQIIQSIRLLQQAATNGTAHNMVLQKLVGEEWQDVETVSVARNMIEQQTYGHIIFTPTDPQAGVVYRISNSSKDTYVSAITVEVIGASDPIASVEFSSAETNALTFKVECNDYATKYYYLCQPAADTAPSVEEVVNNGTESTATELTIENLSEATEYVLYVVPVGENDVQGAVVSAEGKTKSSAIDYYEEYKAGNDITVNGITYTATTYTYALADATSADIDIRSMMNNVTGKKIIFIDSNSGYKAYTASTTNIAGDIVIMSRYSNKRADYQPQMCLQVASTSDSPASLTLQNLTVDASMNIATKNNVYLFNNKGSVADIEQVAFMNCQINHLKQRMYQASVPEYIIKNIILEGNTFCYNYAVDTDNYLFDFKACPRMEEIENISFTNNLFYNDTDVTAFLRIVSYATTTAQTGSGQKLNVNIKQNTFANLTGRNYYFCLYKAASFVVENNIFYANAEYTGTVVKNSVLLCFYGKSAIEGATEGTGRENATDVCGSCSVADNIYFGYGDNGWNIYDNTNTGFVPKVKNTQTKLAETPFSTYDPTNGVLTPKTEYVSYGCQL